MPLVTSNRFDVVIVGGGPAGLSAALMLGRACRRVLVIDSGLPRNRFAAHMHGVLGHDGRAPEALRADGAHEVTRHGGTIVRTTVTGVERATREFVVHTTQTTYYGRRLVVATGLTDVLPDVPGVADRWGAGVVVCPYCDGCEVRGQRLGVLASSPASLHQIRLLRQWSTTVTYFTNGAHDPTDADRTEFAARDIVLDERRVAAIADPVDGPGVTVVLTTGDRVSIDRLFTLPRPVPNDAILQALGATATDTPWGRFADTDPTGRTSVAGVWAIGNVVSPAANVPTSIGAGAAAGGAINLDLVEEDIADALRAHAG